MRLTIDSDVLVFAFIEPTQKIYKEKFEDFKVLHEKADHIYRGVIQGRHELIIPSTVLIETAIVVSRMATEEAGMSVYKKVKTHASEILYLDDKFTEYCIERGVKTLLGGFDAAVLSTASFAGTALLTNDRKFYENIKRHHTEMKAYLLRDLKVEELE
jgi:predicted nucleic acid-binding protein